MELNSRERFEKRAAMEGDREVDARGTQTPMARPYVRDHSVIKAVIISTLVGPAVGCMPIFLFAGAWNWAVAGPFLAAVYMNWAIPAAVAGMLMYLAVSANMHPVVEYVLGALVGFVVASVGLSLRMSDVPWVIGIFGLIPAVVCLSVYRRWIRKELISGRVR